MRRFCLVLSLGALLLTGCSKSWTEQAEEFCKDSPSQVYTWQDYDQDGDLSNKREYETILCKRVPGVKPK